MDEDLYLVELSLEGDQDAFASLVKKHEQRIFRVAFAILGIAEDAEDARQNVLVKLFHHLATYRRESQFTSWLTSIALNESLSQQRARRETVPFDAIAETQIAAASHYSDLWYQNPERAYRRLELKAVIENTSRTLPRKLREVFILRDVEGKCAEETAEILNVTVPTVKSRLFRARLRMREYLTRRLRRTAQPSTNKLTGKGRGRSEMPSQVKWNLD